MSEGRPRAASNVRQFLFAQGYGLREVASRELVAQATRALPAVQAAVNTDDPEIRSRADGVPSKLNAKGLIADQLRLSRAAQVLEIGTPEAKKVLAATGTRAGDEAKAALARLKN